MRASEREREREREREWKDAKKLRFRKEKHLERGRVRKKRRGVKIDRHADRQTLREKQTLRAHTKQYVTPGMLGSFSSFVKIYVNQMLGHSTKKSITIENYEESGILCTLKPAAKMQE